MSKEYIDEEAVKRIEKIVQQESIENANPSEALECLEFICKILNEKRIDVKWVFKNEYITIKQALLKAQEPKKYLTWEDLDFKEEEQTMKVLLNGEEYKLSYFTDGITEYVDLLAGNGKFLIGRYVCDYEKQFFNDLHLERVEK